MFKKVFLIIVLLLSLFFGKFLQIQVNASEEKEIEKTGIIEDEKIEDIAIVEEESNVQRKEALVETEKVIDATAVFLEPVYDSTTQTWIIYSGADLQFALAKAVNNDRFMIMNDLHMGADCEISGHAHNHPDMDGITEELVVGPGGDSFYIEDTEVYRNNLMNTSLTFVSGTGEEIRIYRHDHKRHLVIGSFSYSSSRWTSGHTIMNVTLNFENVTFDGAQTYDVNDALNDTALKSTVKDSSRGGIAIYDAEDVTLNGIIIRNCFGETMNARVNGEVYMGRDAIANGGAINAWYAKNIVINNGLIEGNYSGGVGGGVHFQTYGGTISNTIIRDNHSLRPEAYGSGGGIFYVGVTDQVVLDNVIIDGNTAVGRDPNAYDYGGGITYIGNAGSILLVKDSQIINNLSQRGGGIIFSRPVTFENVQVIGNTATDTTRKENGKTNLEPVGGGVSAAGGTITFKGEVTISDNKVIVGEYAEVGYGAGLFAGTITTEAGAVVTLSKNRIIISNKAVALGGGAYISVPAADLQLNNWTVKDNHITGVGVSGGGGLFLVVNNGNVSATELTVADNSAQSGGGIYISSNRTNTKTFSIEDSVFSNNIAVRPADAEDSSQGSGGGIYTTYYGGLFINNVDFSGNIAEFGGAQPDSDDPDYNTNVALHDNNITNIVSLSEPFVAGTDYAYNNVDINYVGTHMSYIIEYDANGGIGNYFDLVTEDNSDYTVKDFLSTGINAPENMIFAGWNTKADGSGTDFAETQALTVTSHMVLYAQWEEVVVKQVTLQYFSNCEGDPTIQNVPVEVFIYNVGDVVDVHDIDPTREAYNFLHWEVREKEVVEPMISMVSLTEPITVGKNDTFVITNHVELYAQWEAKEVTSPTEIPPSNPTTPDTGVDQMIGLYGMELLFGIALLSIIRKKKI